MKSAAIAAAIVGVVLSTTPGRAVQIREPQPLDASQPVPYYIADGIGRTGYRPGDRELRELGAGGLAAACGRLAAPGRGA